MESTPFAARVSTVTETLQDQQLHADAHSETIYAKKREKEAYLEMARERMKQVCKDAAEFLLSSGIPTFTSPNSLTYRGTAPFPDGWVLVTDTSDFVNQVLTPDGRLFSLCNSDRPYGKKGEIAEFPNDSLAFFSIDENGPYLTHNSEDSTVAPGNREEDLVRSVAKLASKYGKV